MESWGVLASFATVLSHANRMRASDIWIVKRRGAHVSSTPSIELQMGMGTPACFDGDRAPLQSYASIGIDCHNATLASVPAEMRAALQDSRGRYNERFLRAGKFPLRTYKTVQEAYALGTVQGARALGMGDKIGSLAVGKRADVVVFDALSPNMVCGAQHDPVAAIVMHSTPADVVMTIVDGVGRKRDGRLEPVDLATATSVWPDKVLKGERHQRSLSWSDVVKPVLASRDRLQQRIDKIDLVEAKVAATRLFGYDDETLVASL